MDATELMGQVADRVAAYRSENGLPDTAAVPADAVTASASETVTSAVIATSVTAMCA
mgnify:CR=1 FL=1